MAPKDFSGDPDFRPSRKDELVIRPGAGPKQYIREHGRIRIVAVREVPEDPEAGDIDALMRGLSSSDLAGPRSGFGNHVVSAGSVHTAAEYGDLPNSGRSRSRYDSHPGVSEDDLGGMDDTDLDEELADQTAWKQDRISESPSSRGPGDGFSDPEDFWDMSVHEEITGYPGSESHRNSDPVIASKDDLDGLFSGESDTFRRRGL